MLFKFSDQNDSNTVESLAQLSANYCTRYEVELRDLYKSKLNTAWDILYKNWALDKETMNKIYDAIKYLNRMMRLVRMVENSEVTTELIKDEYPDLEILAKIRHQQEFTNPFDKIDRDLKLLEEEYNSEI